MSSLASPDRKSELLENLEKIKSNIPDSVTLIAVSKLKPASDVRVLYDAGHRHFGENYVQELLTKAAELPSDIQWHFIGGLQSNKCKTLASSIPNLFAVETVDTLKKANELNKGRKTLDGARDGRLNVFIQINTSGEEDKSGVEPEKAADLASHIIQECDALSLYGVMTIGALATSREHGENQDFKVRQNFFPLVVCASHHKLSE